ncbi:MAG: SUMF1/EgtB/PvdO family nonheme iron enzyme [Planctomycetes bacterium]|nr:SUMF1/EgtB/PvdO family nonheme iron enzyme [Planctomycetota bacterium]
MAESITARPGAGPSTPPAGVASLLNQPTVVDLPAVAPAHAAPSPSPSLAPGPSAPLAPPAPHATPSQPDTRYLSRPGLAAEALTAQARTPIELPRPDTAVRNRTTLIEGPAIPGAPPPPFEPSPTPYNQQTLHVLPPMEGMPNSPLSPLHAPLLNQPTLAEQDAVAAVPSGVASRNSEGSTILEKPVPPGAPVPRNEPTVNLAPPLDAAGRPATAVLPPPVPGSGERPEASRPGSPSPDFGEYRLLGRLGEGGMGVVYRALHRSLNRIVALKVLTPGDQATPAQITRFIDEARNAAKLSHPHIIPIFDVGIHRGHHYFTMKPIEGPTLEKLMIQDLGRFAREPRAAVELLLPVAEAIQYAHEHGIIHRDIKPSNILIGPDGAPNVMDFGLSKDVSEGQKLTKTGMVLGTPCYMSPEAARADTRQIGPASDVFSLGAVLYEMLTGRPPFLGKTYYETMEHVLKSDPVPVRRANPSVPVDLETICHKALEKTLARRYPSAAALAADLRQFLAGEPIQARPVSTLSLFARRVRRHRVPTPVLMAVGVALAGGLTWGGSALSRTLREREARVKDEEFLKLVRAARALIERRDWSAAVRDFERLAQRAPESAEVRRGLADARAGREKAVADLIHEGRFLLRQEHRKAAALEQLQKAFALDPAQPGLATLLEEAARDTSRVTLLVQPPDAEVALVRLHPNTLLEVSVEPWGRTGAEALRDDLPDGAYVLKLSRSGETPMRVPFVLGEKNVEGVPIRRVELKVAMLAADRVPEGMVVVAGGPFWKGGRGHNAQPSRHVDVPTFLMDRREVSNRDYLRYMEAVHAQPPATWEEGRPPKDGDDWPVLGVSLAEAEAYARWAGKRLPTEEEWEKAARGTDGRRFPWGKEHDPARAATGGLAEGVKTPSPVGRETGDESPYGCLQMAGNAQEWTSSFWTWGASLSRTEHVVRGSAFALQRQERGAWLEECVTRWKVADAAQEPTIGFRCAKDAE